MSKRIIIDWQTWTYIKPDNLKNWENWKGIDLKYDAETRFMADFDT